ncbi:MAG: hypothetical protein Q8K96_01265 [Rubrivivax sp.]|nr:hypothetical protein [Rubrivivax sp.]
MNYRLNYRRLAVRLGVVATVAVMLGGCCVLPFGPGRHGGRGVYVDGGLSQQDHPRNERPGPGRR